VIRLFLGIVLLLALIGQFKPSSAAIQNDYSRFEINAQVIEGLVISENTDSIDYLLTSIKEDAHHTNNWNYYLQFINSLSNSYQIVRNMDKAVYYSEHALHIYDSLKLNNQFLSCQLQLLHGTNLYKQLRLKESEMLLTKTLDLAERINYDSARIYTLKVLGNLNFRYRNFASAIDYYWRSLHVENSRIEPSKVMVSSLYQNIGICYSSMEQNDSALIYFRKSLELKEQHLEKEDPKLGAGYLNFSRFLQIIGEINEALVYINKAEHIYLSYYGGSSPILAPLYFNKGAILITLSDYQDALHYHELSLELYKQEYSSDNYIFTNLYSNFGYIYSLLDRIPESIKYFEKSLEGAEFPEQKVRVTSLLGNAYLELDLHQQAEKYFMKSLGMAQEYLGEKHSQTANSYIHYGSFCRQTKQYNKALASFLQAIKIYKENHGNKFRHVSNTFSNIAQNYLEWGRNLDALNYYQKSIIEFIDEYNEQDIYSNPNINTIEADLNFLFTIIGKSKTFYQYYTEETRELQDLEKCLETVELALILFERLKTTLQGEQTKLLVTNSAYDIYDLAVKASTELYELTRDPSYLDLSFAYSEKGKAAVLLSTLKEMEAIESGDMPEDLKDKEKQIKREIAQYQNVIYEETQKATIDSSKVARLRTRLYNVKLQYDTLVSSLEADYPEYYNLKYSFNVISTADIQNKLKKNSALIEYKLIDSIMYTYIIKHDTAAVIRTDVGIAFTNEVNEYLTYMNAMPDVDSVRSRSFTFGKLGYSLYTKLQLDNPLLKTTTNLIVIPDDILGYLSFEALVSELPNHENSTYNKLKYIIQDYSFSYGYSGTLLFNEYKKKYGGNEILAFAPAYDNVEGHEVNKGSLAIRDLKENLIPLEYTQTEVNAVTKIFKGSTYINRDATEYNFKEHSSEYNILHFAMHTLINDEDPMASKLVFTLNNDSTDDGFLNTYEIYNLDLNAELAVLSACKSGTGKFSKGEGIMSLARGFLYAGVPGIVMTLWSIEDQSGSEIIAGFYKNLKKGERKDIALRNAKITYLDNANQLFAHPYFWAAHVHIGDSSPISPSSRNYIYYGIAGFIIVLLALVLIRRRKRKAI